MRRYVKFFVLPVVALGTIAVVDVSITIIDIAVDVNVVVLQR